MPDPTLDVVICMGSSCFCRGNNRNIEVLRDVLAPLPKESCRLVGHLCQDRCKDGPNIVINGTAYRDIDPVSLVALIRHHQKGGT